MLNATFGELHERGLAASQAGHHDEAMALLALAIEAAPSTPALHTNFGLVLARAGRWERAVEAYRSALALAPAHPPTLAKLGRALTGAGRHGEAAGALGLAALLEPGDSDHANALGVSLAEAGEVARARAELGRATRLDPSHSEAWNNLGQLEARESCWEAAAAAFGEAVALEPSAVPVYRLGVALARLGRSAGARDAYLRAVELDPSLAEAWNSLGHTQVALGELAAALEPLRVALRLRPDYADARYNLGVTLQRLERIDEARVAYQLVLASQGAHADSLNNLAGLCLSEGHPDLAEPLYERALAANPAHPEAQWNLGLAQLAQGDFARGWRNYEMRRPARPFPVESAWKPGVPLEGRTLLLWCEQGLGDAVQFLRYAPVVSAAHRPTRVVLECPARLAGLARLAPGLDAVVERGQPVPAFDYHASLMSLPYLLQTATPALVPPPGPSYTLDARQVEQWRRRLAAFPGHCRVGIVWGGNPDNRAGLQRSMPLETLAAALGEAEGVTMVSLQHGAQSAELDAETAGRLGIERWEQCDLADTAALVSELDLVITVDTLMAHLAGTVGRAVWILLPFTADWRWMNGLASSPWYPKARLFRQPKAGDWRGAMAEVRAAIRELRP